MMRTKDGQQIKLSVRQVAAIILVSVLIVSGTGAGTYAALQASGRFGSSGKIVAIGLQVFEDAALTHLATDVDWGELAAGNTAAVTLWVKNNGTVPIILSLSAEDWTPLIAQQYITFTWNYAPGTVIQKAPS
jgi:hypothetical protein